MAIDSDASDRLIAKPLADQQRGSTKLVIQLLTEIRDAQQQSLEMLRESTLKQRRATRMAIPMMILAFVILAVSPAMAFLPLLMRPRTIAPLPTRSPVVSPR
jgi:hypothetical protein